MVMQARSFFLWKSKTRVTSSNPRVTSSNLRVTSSNPRVTSSNPRVRRLKARVEKLKARVRRSNQTTLMCLINGLTLIHFSIFFPFLF